MIKLVLVFNSLVLHTSKNCFAVKSCGVTLDIKVNVCSALRLSGIAVTTAVIGKRSPIATPKSYPIKTAKTVMQKLGVIV